MLANGLGAVLFGLVTIATSFTEIFFSISDMGMQSWSIREMSRSRDSTRGIVRSLLKAKALVAFGVFFSFSTVSLLIYGFSVFAFSLVADTFTLVLYSIFQATEKMPLYSFSRVLATSVFFAGSYMAVNNGGGIVFVGLSYMLSRYSALGFSLIVGVLSKLVKGPIAELPLSHVFRASAPFAVLVILTTVIPRSDIVMLSVLFTQEPQLAGIYAAALKIFLVTNMVASSLLVGLYPLLSHSFVNDLSTFKYTARKTLKYLLMGGALISLVFVFLSVSLISFLYRPEYSQAGILLEILGSASFLTFLRMGFDWIFNAADMQNKVVKCSSARFLTNIVLDFSVFYIGLIGIATASVLAEMAALAFYIYYVRKSSLFKLKTLSLEFSKILGATLLTIVVFVISLLIVPPLAGLIGLAVYGGILLGSFGIFSLVLVVDQDDVRLLKDVLNR